MQNLVENNDFETQFRKFRGKLLPYAYNILGDSMEAEDVVQEILNNYFLGPSDHIQTPENYLIRSVINRSINEKKKQKVRLAEYPGQWLPIPVNTEEDVYQYADRSKLLHYTLLVLLERLNPKERAIFILKESFDFSHSEVAEMLNVTVENSRQLYKRAKQKLEPDIHYSLSTDQSGEYILHQLTESILQADIEKVKQLLSDDVKMVSDGGPKTSAARNVISGKDDASKLLKAIYGKYFPEGSCIEFTSFNHQPAILYKKDSVTYRCILFEIGNGLIQRMYIIVNPDKLQRIN